MAYNIRNGLINQVLLLLIFSIVFNIPSSAQSPHVISKWDEYIGQINRDSTKRMIELRRFIPGLVYDLRYATTNNFMRRLMYPAKTDATFLRMPAAKALLQVQLELHRMGKALKIYDAYRPYSVTVKFWELVKDERYVANPTKGSGHNRGIAVDLTIVDTVTGKELDMGTDFDNFTDTAHHDFTKLPSSVLENRQLLKNIMIRHGFKAFESEWWHYYLPDAGKYELLDIDFKKLKKYH